MRLKPGGGRPQMAVELSMKPSLRHPRAGRQSGVILLVVMMLISLLAVTAVSFAGSAGSEIEVTRDGAESMRAEFAAEAGLDYALRRMQMAPRWTGTGNDGMTLPDGSVFHVEVLSDEFDAGGDAVSFRIRGASGEGLVQLGAEAAVDTGWSGDAEVAMAILGNEFLMTDGIVRGDVLLTDAENKLEMWDWDTSSWVIGGYGEIEGYQFDNGAAVAGELFKYSNTLYNVGGEEVKVSAPVRAPKIDLDWYLEPGDGKVFYYGTHNLRNVSHQETVVFVLNENQTVSLDNCHFPGGVVVHCPKDYDVLGMYRNKILLKHGTTVGGGEGGCQPCIGLIAPGCEVQFTHEGCAYANSDHSDIYGFNVWNEVFMVRNGRIRGQLIVLNEVTHLRDSEVIFDPYVAANVPYGIEFGGTSPTADLTSVYEWYDEQEQ